MKIKTIVNRQLRILKQTSFFLVCSFIGSNLLAAGLPEDPPFRAWWPIVNKEYECGGRGFITRDGDKQKNNLGQKQFGCGVGFTDHLYFELEGQYRRRFSKSTEFKATEFMTRIEFTDTKAFNETPNLFDFGLMFSLKVPDEHDEAYELETGVLVYKRSGPWRSTANLIFEKEFGNARAQTMELAYAGQFRYKITPEIQPGIEFFGRLGEIGSLSISRQQQKAGIGLFGFIGIEEHLSLKYELSWLRGLTSPAAEHSLKILTEFEYRY